MIRPLLVSAVAVVSHAVAFPAAAAVNVGDTPKLVFRSTEGQQIDLEKLRGKYVLIDFWATWCGPCMDEAGHMVQINDKYGPKGLVFIGISLDRDLQRMKTVAKESRFTWPQLFERQPGQAPVSAAWGVEGIPATFLIDPSGKVVWAGHPAAIDKVLADNFAKNPPRLVDPKTLAEATAALAGAEKALAAKDAAAAVKALAKFPAAAKGDRAVADKYAEAQRGVESAAGQLLDAVKPMIDAKDYAAAAARLREVAASLRGTPTGERALRQHDELMARPEVKAKLAAAQRDDTSRAELAAAQKLKAAKQDDQAYGKLKWLTKEYADTAAGRQAATEAAAYEKDPAFLKRYAETSVAGKAKSALGMAQAYARAGDREKAAAKYKQVAAEFAGTSFAEQAKREMAALGR